MTRKSKKIQKNCVWVEYARKKKIIKEERSKKKVSYKPFTPNPQEEQDTQDHEYNEYLEWAYEQGHNWTKEDDYDSYDAYEGFFETYKGPENCRNCGVLSIPILFWPPRSDSVWTPCGFGCFSCKENW